MLARNDSAPNSQQYAVLVQSLVAAVCRIVCWKTVHTVKQSCDVDVQGIDIIATRPTGEADSVPDSGAGTGVLKEHPLV